MTIAHERCEDCAEDRVEIIKAYIRSLNELLKKLQFKASANEAKH